VFASPREAERFVEGAASTVCRGSAFNMTSNVPSGSRVLVWRNPLGVTQADIFFARGRRAYRVTYVLPPAEPEDRSNMEAVLQDLSCRLPDAAC
jgi:hypothetical protein